MPRDDQHPPKAQKTWTDTAWARMLSQFASRAVVPFLANEAARVEIAGRQWLARTAPRRARIAGRVRAQPMQAALIVLGVAFFAGRRSRR